MMCVLELGRGVERAHQFYPDGKLKPKIELEEFDIDHVACYNGYDKISLFMSKNFDWESGFCSEINWNEFVDIFDVYQTDLAFYGDVTAEQTLEEAIWLNGADIEGVFD